MDRAPGTPGFLPQLIADRQLASSTGPESLRVLCKRYSIQIAKSTAAPAIKAKLVKALDELIETEKAGRRSRKLQGSVARRVSIGTTSAASSCRRSSVSSAARMQPTAAVAAAVESDAYEGAALRRQGGQGPGALPSTPRALPTSPATYSSVVATGLSPVFDAAKLPQATSVPEAGGGEPAPQLVDAGSSVVQLQLEELQKQLISLKEQMAAVQHSMGQLKQQVTITHAAGLRREEHMLTMDLQMQELLTDKLQQAETQDNISRLYSKQEHMLQRQRLDDCQRSVVFKTATPLPTQGTAAYTQKLLCQQLNLSLTVQKVQLLAGKQQVTDSDNKQRRHTYKVVLGSSGERTEVLRCKARTLRGTSYSIDAMLTPEQLASRQRLMPVARQAKSAGQVVRWRYGELFIDNRRYTGPGSLPTPSEQQATAAKGHRSGARSPPAIDADGFQSVQRRQPKPNQQKQPAAHSRKALFTAPKQPLQQRQQGGSSKPKQKVGQHKQQQKATAAAKQPPAKLDKTATAAMEQGGSTSKDTNSSSAASNKITSRSNGKQQPPAGGAGGGQACVASQGSSKVGSSLAKPLPVPGHDGGPAHTKPPSTTAGSSRQRQPPAPTHSEVVEASGSRDTSPVPPSPVHA